MKFVIDCLGGDNSPGANVSGALMGLEKYPDLSVIFVGDEAGIESTLKASGKPVDRSRIEIVHAPDVITGEDKPTDAIRLKKNSSMVMGLRMLREEYRFTFCRTVRAWVRELTGTRPIPISMLPRLPCPS